MTFVNEPRCRKCGQRKLDHTFPAETCPLMQDGKFAGWIYTQTYEPEGGPIDSRTNNQEG